MAVSESNSTVYRFDDFVLNPNTRLLSRGDEVIPLTPRVLDTLLAFVQRPGETISKDELMSAIWADSFVEESNLTQNVAVLRKALGEDARAHRYIVTVPGTGYRFVPEVIEEDGIIGAQNGDEPSKARVVDEPPVRVESVSRPWLFPAAAGLLVLFAAIGTYFYLTARAGPVPTVARTRQITSFTGLDLYPAFAPNGTTLAFASNKTGAFEIFVRQLIPGAGEIQLTSDGNQNFQPAFSPDGSRIAYNSVVRGGVWVIPSTGGTPKRLTDFGSHPSWSPDGTTIVFQSDPITDLGSGARNAMPPSTLWLVAADGLGDARQLTAIGSPPGGHGSPEWSPDGKRIMFDTNDWAASNIWSIAIDGSDLRPILPHAYSFDGDRWVTASDAVYTRDGRSIFYIADMGLSIKTVSIDSNGFATSEPTKIFDASAARLRLLAVSPDGKRLIYSAINTTSNLNLTEIAADGTTSEPKQLTRAADSRAVSPAFSPDGKLIAYQEYTTGTSANIKVMNTDGTNDRQITTIMGFNPSWFPGGDRVGFSVPRGERSEYWFASADGSVERKLFSFDDNEVFNARLSVDGKSLIFNSKRSGTINLWQISVEGGEAKQLTFDKELAGFPAVSHDGKWIAFQIRRGADTHVAYIPAEGGEMIQLTNEPGLSWVHDWAPDGDRIIFAGRRGTIWNVYSVSRTTREVKQLTHFDKLGSYVRYPAWSPLGDKIAYEYAESTGNIWMIELN
ncbi:MAG TPA: winged helix-turn-helix domain-containing protein [Pyrinomonadaceae bacterium]|nr:winged helix-turn-helix domain-containing protein [Pyrinomonadaceae bacterium]